MDIVSYLMGKKSGGGGSIPEYEGSYSVTPSESAQTLATKDKKCTDDISVGAIPSQYIVPTGTKQITQNGQIDVTQYATADVNVSGGGGTIKIDEISVADGLSNPSITKGEMYYWNSTTQGVATTITARRICYATFVDTYGGNNSKIVAYCTNVTGTSSEFIAKFKSDIPDYSTSTKARYVFEVRYYNQQATIQSITYSGTDISSDIITVYITSIDMS